jgi:hypothetical protein
MYQIISIKNHEKRKKEKKHSIQIENSIDY